jgi:hypothetical protein
MNNTNVSFYVNTKTTLHIVYYIYKTSEDGSRLTLILIFSKRCQHWNNKTFRGRWLKHCSHLLPHDCHTVQQSMCIIKAAFFIML